MPRLLLPSVAPVPGELQERGHEDLRTQHGERWSCSWGLREAVNRGSSEGDGNPIFTRQSACGVGREALSVAGEQEITGDFS